MCTCVLVHMYIIIIHGSCLIHWMFLAVLKQKKVEDVTSTTSLKAPMQEASVCVEVNEDVSISSNTVFFNANGSRLHS